MSSGSRGPVKREDGHRRGNPRKQGKAAAAPPPAAVPTETPEPEATMPSWFTPLAAEEWIRIKPDLVRRKIYTLRYQQIIVSYCLAVEDLAANTAIITKEGRVIEEDVFNPRGQGGKSEGEKGDKEETPPATLGSRKKPHPAVKMRNDAMTRVRQFGEMLGLSPMADRRLGHGQSGIALPKNEAAEYEAWRSASQASPPPRGNHG